MARRAGLDGLYLVAELSDLLGRGARYDSFVADGFDAGVVHAASRRVTRWTTLRMRAMRKLRGGPEIWPYSDSIVDDYPRGPRIQPCVYPNWDNTPRAGRRGLADHRRHARWIPAQRRGGSGAARRPARLRSGCSG